MNAVVKASDNVPAQFLDTLERIALDPAIDPERLMKILDVQERMMGKKSESEFFAAMTAAQTEIGRIKADKQNTQTHSMYATYAAIDRVVRPIYTTHGFSLSFGTETGAPEGSLRVVCDVAHRGGHTKRYTMDVPADGKGAKGGDVMTKTHAAGAAMQYGMRYLIKGIFNIAIGEDKDDDDGNSGASLPNLWKTKQTRTHYSTELQRAWGQNDTAELRKLWDELDTDQKANVWFDFNSVQRKEMNAMLLKTKSAPFSDKQETESYKQAFGDKK